MPGLSTPGGFLPIGLAYHGAYSFLAAAMMWVLVKFALLWNHVEKRVLVFQPFKLFATDYIKDFVVCYLEFLHQVLDSLFHHYPFFFAHLDFRILSIRVNSQHKISYERERHCCPD